MLIVIEGIDGSGKATQTKLLVEHLRREAYRVETLDFPVYERNFFGRMVRRYLDGEFGPPAQVNPYLASTLYAFDRWESAEQIRQWRDQGAAIVLDRYVESNLIHQSSKMEGAAQRDFMRWLLAMEYDVLKLPKPDLTLFLQVPMQLAYTLIQRRGRQLDGHERDLTHLEAAARMCQKLAKDFQWVTIDCAPKGELAPPEIIHQKIWNAVRERYGMPPEVGEQDRRVKK